MDDRLDGIDLRAVPVGVEERGELRDNRAHDERVHVDEIVGHAAHEILVGDVAASCHHHRAIGDEKFVVHAMVEPSEIRERSGVFTEQALPTAAERIEQAHLDVRKCRDTDE